MIKEIKKTVPWTYVINDLNGEEIIGTFYEKEMQKINQQEFRIEKVIKKEGNKLYVKWKDMIVHLIAGLIKKTYYKLVNIFLNLMSLLVEILMSKFNCATKTDLK